MTTETAFALDASSWRGKLYQDRPGWTLVHATIHVTEGGAHSAVAGWRHMRGHATKVLYRTVRADRVTVCLYVATAWKKPEVPS